MTEGAVQRKFDDTMFQDDAEERVNILVVDDLPDKLFAYASIIEELGQNVVTAHSGEEALKLVLRDEFAVILMDVNMPGLDGFETASLIRNRKKSAHTPIIFLTAFMDDVRMVQGYASGAVDYLPTPVMPEILQAKVRVFIELSQMRRRAALQAKEHALRTAAEEADRKKDEFLAMLAHELRNPLAPIRNALETLKLTQDAGQRETIQEMIERQLNHLIHLVDDLMDVSRITKGKIELRKQVVNLKDALTQAAETSQPLMEQSQHTLLLDIPSQDIWLLADAARIAQIFSNLLNNAAKYTNPRGTVTVTVVPEEDAVTIRVCDNGIGIPPDKLASVFELFSQVDSTLERTQGGLGIGLTLVKQLVEMHGGSIGIHSEGLGKGSTFSVRFPVIEAPESHAAQSRAPESSASAPLRVVIVDDNEASAKTMGWMLELDGHETRIAHDAQSAIDHAKEFMPHVVMLDIGMPGMNGYELCREMRRLPELRQTIFIAQTGWGQEEHRRRSREAGFHHHLVKPVELNRLQQLFSELAF